MCRVGMLGMLPALETRNLDLGEPSPLCCERDPVHTRNLSRWRLPQTNWIGTSQRTVLLRRVQSPAVLKGQNATNAPPGYGMNSSGRRIRLKHYAGSLVQ